MIYNGSKTHIENAKKASILGSKKLNDIKLKRIILYNENPSKCKFCDCDLSYEKKNKKFCNSSCSAKYNNKNRILSDHTKKLISDKLKGKPHSDEHINKIKGDKNGRWKFINDSKECEICGINFIRKKITKSRISRAKFCSKECRNIFQTNNMKEKHNNGLLKGWTTRNIISYPERFFIKVLNNNDIKFEHNYPVSKKKLGINEPYSYFLDFFIGNKKIDLEIDGKQHEYRKEHDNYRDLLLLKNGYKLYRIKWKNINSEKGKDYIKNEINKFLEFYNNN